MHLITTSVLKFKMLKKSLLCYLLSVLEVTQLNGIPVITAWKICLIFIQEPEHYLFCFLNAWPTYRAGAQGAMTKSDSISYLDD